MANLKKSSLPDNLRKGIDELEQLRDEIKLRLHLAGMDATTAWNKLEPRLDKLEQQLEREGSHVADTTNELTNDLVKSFRQFRDRLFDHQSGV